MGSGILHFFSLLAAPRHPTAHFHPNILTHSCQKSQIKLASFCCFCTSKYGARTGGSQWESRSNGTHKEQPRYSLDEFFTGTNGPDEAEYTGLKNSGKQRIWWSEDSLSWDSDDEHDDEEVNELFRFLERALELSSILKVLRGFAWTIPAVIISVLVGNGTDAIFTALVLPLAQSAFSMALDSLWGASSDNMRPKARSRKRAFWEASDSSRMRKRRDYDRQTAESTDDYQPWVALDGRRMRKRREYSGQMATGDYQSWVVSDNVGAENRQGTERSFGGWDDLDKHGRKEEMPKSAPVKGDRKSTKGKLGRRGRNRSTPSLVRMLIALFPFLGFWTKLL